MIAGCHCGDVKLEFHGEADKALACNCSICARKGSLLWFTPRSQVKFVTPEDNAGSYTFNRHMIQHRFCKRCGIHVYGAAVDPKTGEPTVAINLRCVEGLDLDALKVHHFNGRAL